MSDDLDFPEDVTPVAAEVESFENAKPITVVPAPREEPTRAPERALIVQREPRSSAGDRGGIIGRAPPNSPEAEQYLLSCCLLDGADTIAKCLEARLPAAAFYSPANRIIYECICAVHQSSPPVDLAVVAQELQTSGRLQSIGGFAYLTQISASIPTTAQSTYFLAKVRELWLLRELIKAATGAVERAFTYNGEGIEEFLAETRLSIDSLGGATRNVIHAQGLFSFKVPAPGDPSIILGNRFLNRGDGGILTSTSGMGKSSISLQMATLWALGREAFGMRPNGCPTSLIIQSEDSDGDIGEVAGSLAAALKLSADERDLVSQRVQLVTERVARGQAFVSKLRTLITKHKPDLVWINPLQAFMSGDITESKDLGDFLREGLNSLNNPPSFGYIIVHHTTKPPQEKKDRLWHEVMYDMAGGAELTNWARFVMSLRADEEEGKFKLVLAKRGRRAGITRKVPQGAGYREEIVTSIGLQHATGTCVIDGQTLPMIFWEERELQPKSDSSKGSGRPREFTFSKFHDIFPKDAASAISIQALFRMASDSGISDRSFRYLIDQSVEDGLLVKIKVTPGHGFKYHLRPV